MNLCDSPILTACVVTYNRWDRCLKALRSVCEQEGVSIEVILVEDCSNEPMPREMAEYIKANGVRYIRHKQNKGLAAARNTAIKNAQGEYFSFCDDDDQWPQGQAAGLVNGMKDLASGVHMAVGLSKTRQKACGKLFNNQPRLSRLFIEGFCPPVGSQIYRTELIKKVGGYNADIRSGVDHDLWVNLLEADPQVAVYWGDGVVVGNDPNRQRMTTNESERRRGIKEALIIWQPKIKAVLGEDFYLHFCHSYEQYLGYKFFMQAVKAKKYSQMISMAANPKIFKMFLENLSRKINQRQRCNLFPEYIRMQER